MAEHCCLNEERIRELETGQAETRVYMKLALEKIDKVDMKLENMSKPLPELIPAAPTKDSFWDTKAGQTVPLAAAIIVLIVVLGLVGANYIQVIEAAKPLISK